MTAHPVERGISFSRGVVSKLHRRGVSPTTYSTVLESPDSIMREVPSISGMQLLLWWRHRRLLCILAFFKVYRYFRAFLRSSWRPLGRSSKALRHRKIFCCSLLAQRMRPASSNWEKSPSRLGSPIDRWCFRTVRFRVGALRSAWRPVCGDASELAQIDDKLFWRPAIRTAAFYMSTRVNHKSATYGRTVVD
jgi:hypothetical protein